MNTRHLTLVITSVFMLGLLSSCGDGTPERVVSETPIKTEILGLKLCSASNGEAIKKAISKATDKDFYYNSEKDGSSTRFRLSPRYDNHFSYGGVTWHYMDVYVNKEGIIAAIELTASLESQEQAQNLYDKMSKVLFQKYGVNNKSSIPEGRRAFWTDDKNSIGLVCYKGMTVDGRNRYFCSMYYVNRDLYGKIESAMQDV